MYRQNYPTRDPTSRQGVWVLAGTLERELDLLKQFFSLVRNTNYRGDRIATCRKVTSKAKIGNTLNVYYTNYRSVLIKVT